MPPPPPESAAPQVEAAVKNGRYPLSEIARDIAAKSGISKNKVYEQALKIKKELHAVVRSHGDEHIATFFDANISASGDTETEAVSNLKDTIIGIFECLIR